MYTRTWQLLVHFLSANVITEGNNGWHNVEEHQARDEHLDHEDVSASEELWNDYHVNEHLTNEG